MLGAGPEPFDDAGPVFRRHLPGDDQRCEAAQILCRQRHTEALAGVLGEDQGLVALGDQLIQSIADVGELARLAGPGIGVADLLEARDEFEYMLDAHLGAEGLQVDDSLLLGHLVAPALRGVQFDGNLRHQFRRQILQDVILLAAELQFPVALSQLVAGPVLPAVALLVVVDELQDRSQLLFVVLDRRAGQGPGAASRQLFEDVTGFVPVLDALGFVRDDKIPGPAAQLAVEVGSQALIPDEGHVGSCGPLPLPVGSRAPDDDGGEFGRPAGDLPTPLIQNTGWRDDQAGAQFAAGAQDPNCGDGLHRLAEPHVVGQQQAAVRHERAHPVPLERHQVAAPIQMLGVTPMCRGCPQDAPQAVR